MTMDRRKRIEELFHKALTLPRHEQTTFLDTACAEDATLREQVETLIASHNQPTVLTTQSEFNAATLLYTDSEKESVERSHIGPYRVIREVGHGGMGTVYLASRSDELFDKQVAIKIVRRGMDSASVLRRFHRERQILASLDHPNIARLFDGGTTEDGLPYFVMEYIEGKPLYEYCDAQDLDTAERVKLFRKVCAAVQYAHQNLVVHRDLKPGNILVTSDGEPKLLDFGIAKLINPDVSDPENALTVASERVMTPQYASPEQVRGESITTASDVYSLGIVLYELLTGQRPYKFKSLLPHEIARVICEQEPSKPSDTATRRQGDAVTQLDARTVAASPRRRVAASQLKGDLDNIVMKSLNKEPERRYLSVDQFSEDLRRHLEGLPVIARPNTLSYRAGKFIRRNKLAVTAASLILLTLIAGIIGTTWQAAVARSERARAERRFEDVRKLANSFLFEFHDGIAKLSGATPMRELLVKRALEYLDSLTQEAGGDASLQRELATAYEKVGEIQGDPYEASLGDTTSAMESYRKAQAIREALLTAAPDDAGLRQELAGGYLKIGDILWVTGDLDGAQEVYEKSRAIFEALAQADPANAKLRYDLSTNFISIGDTHLEAGDLDAALASHRRGLAIREELAASTNDPKHRAGFAVSHVKIGDDLTRSGNIKEALDNYYKSIAILEALVKAEPTNASFRQYLESTYQRTGLALMQDNNPKLALEYYNKCVAFSEQAVKADPQNVVAKRNLMGIYISIGSTLGAQGQFTEAAPFHRKGIDMAIAISAADPSNAQARRDIIVAHYEAARILRQSKNYAEAERNYRKALEVSEAILADDPRGVQSRKDVSDVYDGLGNLKAETSDLQAALGFYEKALSLRSPLANEAPDNVEIPLGMLGTLYNLGLTHTEIAANRKLSTAKRLEHLREARSLFERSQTLVLGLRDRGTLPKAHEGKVEELATALKECDAAIEALGKSADHN